MSELIDKKQLIHVASECIVLLGVTYYFHSRNKSLQTSINDMSERLSTCENRLQTQEETIKQLINVVNAVQGQALQGRVGTPGHHPQPQRYHPATVHHTRRTHRSKRIKPRRASPNHTKLSSITEERGDDDSVEEREEREEREEIAPTSLSSFPEEKEREEDRDTNSESDLDAELRSELEELEDEEEKEERGDEPLKKRS